ncbi:MAG: MFS transporter [Candidatus Sigynarchaeota archaeon]
MTQQVERVKLNYGRTFLIGFGFLTTAAWSLYNVKMPLILSYFLPAISWADFFIGVIMVLDNITAILLQPYFGALSDKTKTKFGKRIPYLMIGIPSAVLSFVLMPHAPNLAILIILIMCFNIAMAFYRAPVVALMPDLTPSEVRAKGNAIINLMGGVGTISSYLIGAFLLDDDPSGATAFSVSGIIMLACLIVVVLTVNEQKITAELSAKYGPDFASDRTEIKKYRAEDIERGEKKEKQGLMERISTSNTVLLFREKEKSALFMLLAIFSWFMATNAVETFFSLYAVNVLGIKAGQASLLLLLVPVAFIAFAIPAGIISEKIGRRKTIKIGLIIILSSIFALIFITNFTVLASIIIIYGIAWSMININSITVVWQLAPDGRIGAYTGIYYLFSAASAIISPVVAGLFFSIFYEIMGQLRYILLFPYAFGFLALAFVFMTRVKRGEVKMSKEEIEALKRIYEQADD